MSNMEQLGLNAQRSELVADMRSLIEKYRRIFDWDIPEIDQRATAKLSLASIQYSLGQYCSEISSLDPEGFYK